MLWDGDFDRRTVDDQITATGRLEVGISVDVEIDIGAETARLVLVVDDELDLKVDTDIEVDLPRISIPVATHRTRLGVPGAGHPRRRRA